MLAGDPAAAVATLRRSYEALAEMGERGFRSTIAGLLAHALCALGEDDEADRFSRACEDAAAPEDAFSQVLWRSARAKVLARRGDAGPAEAAAREAVEIAERTDLLNTQADALLDLAEVLERSGRNDEARAAAQDAAECFERKGNLVSLARARAAVS
jgi:ATP/maltotriose-dependent transcriptional regulator MalT